MKTSEIIRIAIANHLWNGEDQKEFENSNASLSLELIALNFECKGD